MQVEFTYHVALHLHHKTSSYENQLQLFHTQLDIYFTLYICVSSYELSTYTDSFSGKLGNSHAFQPWEGK